MKVLTQQEVTLVSGAGLIQDALSTTGSDIGNSLYGLVADVGITLPLVGKISVGSLFPDLGKSIGSELGGKLGGAIESAVASIPLIGGWLNSLLGN